MQNDSSQKRRFTRTLKNFSVTPKGGGFTLIELLVVVAIISLLSSVVMASLTSARGKAKDAAIKEAAIQLQNLMALNYSDSGGYGNLNIPSSGFVKMINQISGCSSVGFSGNHATKAQEICEYIFNNAISNGSYRIAIIGVPLLNASSNDTAFSWIISLNNGNWYCVGSSGKSESATFVNNNPGCWYNP